jgi:hypothetical protein
MRTCRERLIRTGGPPFDARPFDPDARDPRGGGHRHGDVHHGNSCDLCVHGSLDGPQSAVTQSKQIERQVFRAPGTSCHSRELGTATSRRSGLVCVAGRDD